MGCGQSWSGHNLTLRDDHSYEDHHSWGGARSDEGSKVESGTWKISSDGKSLELSKGGSYPLENFSPDAYFRQRWNKQEGG